MTGFAKTLFFVFMIICLITGLPLLVIPGRFLGIFKWAPVEPMIVRLLGAALLSFSWGSWKSLRATNLRQTLLFVEMLVILCLFGAIGWFRHLLIAYYWPGIWAVAILLLVFGLLWVFVRLALGKSKE
jgi:hypothetical protein